MDTYFVKNGLKFFLCYVVCLFKEIGNVSVIYYAQIYAQKGPGILYVCSMQQFMVIFLDFSSLFYI